MYRSWQTSVPESDLNRFGLTDKQTSWVIIETSFCQSGIIVKSLPTCVFVFIIVQKLIFKNTLSDIENELENGKKGFEVMARTLTWRPLKQLESIKFLQLSFFFWKLTKAVFLLFVLSWINWDNINQLSKEWQITLHILQYN